MQECVRMFGWLAEHCIFPVLIPLLPSLNMTTTSPVEWGHLQFLIYVLFTSKLTMAINPTRLGGIQTIFSDDKMLLLKHNNAAISAVLGDVQPLFPDNKS
jgi:hypothetical protein